MLFFKFAAGSFKSNLGRGLPFIVGAVSASGEWSVSSGQPARSRSFHCMETVPLASLPLPTRKPLPSHIVPMASSKPASPNRMRNRTTTTPSTPELINGIYVESFERKMKQSRAATATSGGGSVEPPPPPPSLPPLYDSAKTYAVKLLEGREPVLSSAHITSPGKLKNELYLPFSGEQKLADVVFIEREGDGGDVTSPLQLARSLASELGNTPDRIPPAGGDSQPCDVVVFLYSSPSAKPQHPFPRIADDPEPSPQRSKPVRRGRSSSTNINDSGGSTGSGGSGLEQGDHASAAATAAPATATVTTTTAVSATRKGSSRRKVSPRASSSLERFLTLLKVTVALLLFLGAIFVPMLVGNAFLQYGKQLIAHKPPVPATGARATGTAAAPLDAAPGNKFLARLFHLVRARRRQADRLAHVRDILRNDDTVHAYAKSGKRGASRGAPWKFLWTAGKGVFVHRGSGGGHGGGYDQDKRVTGSGVADWYW